MGEAWWLIAMFVIVLSVVVGALWAVVGLAVWAGPAAVRVAGQVVAIAGAVAVVVVLLVVFGPADLAQVLEAVAAGLG